MKVKGLELIKLDSEVTKHFDENKDGELESFIYTSLSGKYYVVSYLDYKVLIGTWDKEGFHFYNNETFEHKYIQKLRIFNTDEELLIWRTQGNLKGRLRKDDRKGSSTDVIVARQVLFGTDSKPLNNTFTEIYEKRGTRLILPFKNLKVDIKKDRIAIKTYNYIGYNKVYQATYKDCRFVSFCDQDSDLE
jgi:CRISPR-associated protein (TIGR03984 family)